MMQLIIIFSLSLELIGWRFSMHKYTYEEIFKNNINDKIICLTAHRVILPFSEYKKFKLEKKFCHTWCNVDEAIWQIESYL